ncbi:hypothetical protein ACHQM5_011964 [Ranunculus cassubicifolius]
MQHTYEKIVPYAELVEIVDIAPDDKKRVKSSWSSSLAVDVPCFSIASKSSKHFN